MRQSVKALQSQTVALHTKTENFSAAKAALGLAFGTAKAQKQLKAAERNAVKADQLQDALEDIQHEIGKTAAPTIEEVKKAMQQGLPIPKHNMDAESPEEAYDLESIVTDNELKAMPVKELYQQNSLDGIKQVLPYSSSNFVNERILRIVGGGGTKTSNKDRKTLRRLVYISYLMAYLCKVRPADVKNRRKVEMALRNPPGVITNHLGERYTENDT